jgi:LPS-assembly protein
VVFFADRALPRPFCTLVTQYSIRFVLALCALWIIAPASAYAQSEISGCKLVFTQQNLMESIASGQYRLTGTRERPAQIDCDEIQLFADVVQFHSSEGRITAEGHVLFVSGTTNRISAERLEFNTKTRTGTFYVASGTAIMKAGTPGESAGEQEPYAFFWGDELHKVGPTKYKIVRGGFTACVQPTPRWEVSSGTLTLNLDDYVLLKNALFRVKGVPLLYLPIFYYPMQEDDRATGFLMPTYGTATVAGQKITNAFFWAISRSHDATFTHDWLTKTGHGLGAEYRYNLGSGSTANARFYRLNEKPITATVNGVEIETQGRQSYTLNADLVQRVGGHMQARGLVDYFSSLVTQQKYQQNVYHATNRQRRYVGNLTGSWAEYVMNATFEQGDIFDTATRFRRVGAAPRVTVSRGERPIGRSSIYFGMAGEYVTFTRKVVDDAQEKSTLLDQGLTRLDIAPVLRVPFTKWPFLTVNSVVSWRGTYWSESIDASKAQVPEKVGRSFFDFQSRVTGPVFHRIWDNATGRKVKHVIEPSVVIHRTTTVDNFDQIVKLDSNDSILGGTTRYTYALTNRVYTKTDNSREVLNVGVSQTYYTDARDAQYDRNYPNSNDKETNFSPIAITARVAPTTGIQGNVRTEWDHQVSAIRTIAASTTLNTSYWLQGEAGWSLKRSIPELPGFSEASASHFLYGTTNLRTRRNNLGGTYSFNYDMRRDQFLQQRYMAYYNAQCCGVAVEWQSWNMQGTYAGVNVQQDRRFNISVTLAGIGAVPSFFGALSGQPSRR